jgi:hypothetical protein
LKNVSESLKKQYHFPSDATFIHGLRQAWKKASLDLKDKPYAILGVGKFDSSDSWASGRLIKDKLTDFQPKMMLLTSSAKEKLEYFSLSLPFKMPENMPFVSDTDHNISHFVFVDDASYSGDQLFGRDNYLDQFIHTYCTVAAKDKVNNRKSRAIDLYKKIYDVKTNNHPLKDKHIYFIVSAASKSAINLFETVQKECKEIGLGVHFYYDQHINLEPVNHNLSIQATKLKSATIYQHKLADTFSLGLIFSDDFFDPIPPYRNQELIAPRG